MSQPLSLEVLARNACVQLLLYEGTRDGVLSLLESESFKAVSESLLNRIVSYSPKVLTDRMLSALISGFAKELNLSKCANVSLDGVAGALKRSPHVRQLNLRKCSQLMHRDTFVCLGQIQLPITHLSLKDMKHLEDATVHVLISQLPHLTTLDLSENNNLTDNVFLLDVDDQNEKDMSTSQKKTSFHYKYSLTSVNISECYGLSMLSVLHLTSLCGPRLKHINLAWTKINCEALLFLAGYNLIDTLWLLHEELLRQNEKGRKKSLYNAVQNIMKLLKYLVHHKASNSDTKSEEAAAERSRSNRTEAEIAKYGQESENSSETAKENENISIVEEVSVSPVDSVELVSKQTLDNVCEHQAMSKLGIDNTPNKQFLDTNTESGLNTTCATGRDTTGNSAEINKDDTSKTNTKKVEKMKETSVIDDIEALLEEWNSISALGENRQASPMFDCSLVSLDIASIPIRDNIIGAFCLEKFFEVNKKLEKFGISWNGLSGDLMKRLVPSLNELREVDMVECTMLGTEGVRVLSHGCVKLNKINLKNVEFSGDLAIKPALSISSISSLCLAGNAITDASMLLIADKQAKSLTELDVLSHEITEKGINAICEHCINLRVLTLPTFAMCDTTLLLLNETCHQITDLSFRYVPDFDTFSMGGLANLAQHLTNLRRLDLSENQNVTDEGLCAVLSYCTLLEMADLRCIDTITVAPFLPMISGHTRDERKEKVDKETTELIQKAAFSRSSVYAPSLRKLVLEDCDHVNGDQIYIVMDACRGTLKVTIYIDCVQF